MLKVLSGVDGYLRQNMSNRDDLVWRISRRVLTEGNLENHSMAYSQSDAHLNRVCIAS